MKIYRQYVKHQSTEVSRIRLIRMHQGNKKKFISQKSNYESETKKKKILEMKKKNVAKSYSMTGDSHLKFALTSS